MSPPGPILEFGPLRVDLDRAQILGGEQEQALTAIEQRLLRYLADRLGQNVSQAELLVAVWGYKPGLQSRAVAQTLWRLRKKLEPDPEHPRYLHTAHAQGLRLELPPPAPVTPAPEGLWGRDQLLMELGTELTAGLVVLHGPGGVGKTRLADELLRRAQAAGRATLRLDLSPLRSLRELRGALRGALGMAGTEATDEGRALGMALSSRGDLLLLFDNLEQMEEEIWAELEALAARAPRCALLATTRALPRGRALRVTQVRGLQPEPAVRLLRQGLPPGAELEPGEEEALLALAAALDHLPLALLLAAKRLGGMAPSELLPRLRQRLSLLRDPQQPEHRHGALRMTLAWSWELLRPELRQALAALCAPSAPFDLELAEALLPEVEAALDLLHELEGQSLLRRGAGLRWGHYAVVRAWCLEQQPAAERALAQRRLGQWGLFRARALAEQLERQPLIGLAELEPHLDAALQAQIDQGEVAGALELAGLLDQLRAGRTALPQRLEQVERALALVGGPSLHRGRLLRTRAELGRQQGQVDRAAQDLRQAEEMALAAGDDQGLARMALTRGALHHMQGRLSEAEHDYARAASLFEQAGLHSGLAMVLVNQALLRGRSGPSEAVALLERAVALLSRSGHRRLEALALDNLGALQAQVGLAEAARHSRSAALQRARGLPGVEALVLLNLATEQLNLGHSAEALPLLMEAEDRLAAQGQLDRLALARCNRAVALMAQQRDAEAEALLLELRRSLAPLSPEVDAVARIDLGVVAWRLGRLGEARLWLLPSAEDPARQEQASASALALLAALLAEQGEVERPAALLAQARAREDDQRIAPTLRACAACVDLAAGRRDGAGVWAELEELRRGSVPVSQQVVLEMLAARMAAIAGPPWARRQG